MGAKLEKMADRTQTFSKDERHKFLSGKDIVCGARELTYRTEALFNLGSFRTIFLLRYNTHCFCSSAVCARTKSSFAEIRSMFTKHKSCHNCFVKLKWLGYERQKLREFAFNNNIQGPYRFLNPKFKTFSRLFPKQ